MPDPDPAHVTKVRRALSAACDVEAAVSQWVDKGRPGGATGLRSHLEAVADPGPVEKAVTALRAAGAASVR